MRKLLICLAVPSLLLAACGNSAPSASEDPKGALIAAFERLSDAEGVTFEAGLDSTPEDLAALSEGDLSPSDAAKFLSASVTVSGTQGENVEDPTDDESIVLVTVDGKDWFEMRTVEGDIYARADVPALISTLGKDKDKFERFINKIRTKPVFDWLGPAIAGDWIVLRDAQQLAQQFAGGSVDSSQQKKIVDDLSESIEKNADVTNEGEDDAGSHLVVTLPLRATFEDIVQDLQGMAGPLGTGAPGTASEDIPEGDMHIDFWVSDGNLTQMELDLAELATLSGDAAAGSVGLVVTFDEFTGGVEPVADAVEIDPTAIGQLISTLMTGSEGAAAPGLPPDFDCSQLQGAPPQVIELYKKECPELQG